MTTGQDLKEAGITQVLENNPDFKDTALGILRELAVLHDQFTSDDLRSVLRMLKVPSPKHPNCIGAVFSAAARAGIIRRIGYEKAETKSCHARVVSVWRKA